MDTVYKIAIIAINLIFLVIYIINFIIALLRDIKDKKALKNKNYLTVDAEIIDIKEDKKKVTILVEFIGPNNLVLFSHTFEMSLAEFNKNPYTRGQKIKLAYVDVANQKKIHTFPLIIEGSKIRLEKGPLFANAALIFVAAYFNTSALIKVLTNFDLPFSQMFPTSNIFINLLMYLFLFSYLMESLFSISKVENQNYLKLFGNTTKARVITFKLGGSKNVRGYKESRMTIEYRNHLGELTKTNLASYMYTETQEEYIDIVYDPKNSKNVVYLRK